MPKYELSFLTVTLSSVQVWMHTWSILSVYLTNAHLVLPKYERCIHTWAILSYLYIHTQYWASMQSYLVNTKYAFKTKIFTLSFVQVWMHRSYLGNTKCAFVTFTLSIDQVCIHTWTILSVNVTNENSYFELPKCECVIHTWALLSDMYIHT